MAENWEVGETLDDSFRVTVFRLHGEIDIQCANGLERDLLHFAATTEWGQDVIVDCAELEYIDPAGMSTLVRVHLALRDLRRRLVVTNLSPDCRKAFEVSGVIDVIGDYDTK